MAMTITKTNVSQILFDTLYKGCGIVVSKSSSDYVTEGGRKIVKAGTPMVGSLTERGTAFTTGTSGAVGVLIHDVDITDENANGSLMYWGSVDLNKVHKDVQSKLTSAAEDLEGKVFVIK